MLKLLRAICSPRKGSTVLLLALFGTAAWHLHPSYSAVERHKDFQTYHTTGISPRVEEPELIDSEDRRRALTLLRKDFYAGLDPAYAATIQHEEIRPGVAHINVKTSSRTLDMDFRQPLIAKPPVRKKAYEGYECRTHFFNELCVAPGQCPEASSRNREAMRAVHNYGPCLSWLSGRLPEHDDDEELPENKKSPNAPTSWDFDGEWRDPLWVPNTRTSKLYRFFTPSDARQCLRGKRILIEGDALLRQLFMRLIQFMREMPTHVEHAFAESSVYVIYEDGSDSWTVPRTQEYDDDANNNSAEKDADQGVALRVFFNWITTVDFEDHQSFLRDASWLEIDHMIVGFNYWMETSDDFVPLPTAFETFWNETRWQGSVSYFATPSTEPATPPWSYTGRNAIMRDFIAGQAQQGRSIYMLPTDHMAKAAIRAPGTGPSRNCAHFPGGLNTCMDDVHWGAGFLSMMDEPIMPGMDGIKAPPNFDCRDIFNLNVLQNWLNNICE